MPKKKTYIRKPAPLKPLLSQLVKVKGTKQAQLLLAALFTDKEQAELARRLEIARMLLSGHTYAEVREKLSVANATVAHVQSLMDGVDARRLAGFLFKK